MNELEHIWGDVVDCYYEAEEEYKELPERFAERYPFQKSMDEYTYELLEWRESIEEYLKEVEK